MSASSPRVRIVGPDGRVVGVVVEARTAWARMVGLLGHRHLPVAEGLLLAPAWSIHTWFMRMPIDVVFLDADGIVLRVFPQLPAWRLVSGTRRARSVLEFGAGTLAVTPLAPGDRVRLDPEQGASNRR